MNKKNRCLFCRDYFEADTMVTTPKGKFCTYEHAIEYANKKTAGNKKKKQRAVDSQQKKELMTRSKWFARLQALVNQFVRYRDSGEPCCTCGTTNPNIKYDAGHCFTVAARSDIRFELTNIHRQCSNNCNVHGSGMRNEYEQFIIVRYGADHLEWLKEVKPSLKVQFPNWQDIEQEIIRYRKLLRSVGVTPNR